MSRYRRRQFLIASGALLAAPLVHAQPSKVPRVGMLTNRAPMSNPESEPSFGAFLRRMNELGFVAGRTVQYEWRYADGKYAQMPALAAELAARKVEVILAHTPPAIQAAKDATATVPIVMVAVGDPVLLGLVQSFSKPGGNVTGVSNAVDEISTKYLELLRQFRPKLARVASLANNGNPNYRKIYASVESAGRRMGIQTMLVEARTPEEIGKAFDMMKSLRAEALIVQADGTFSNERKLIADLALKARLPSIYWIREPVEAGGLMSYGQHVSEDFRNAANFVARILRGAHPRDLPVERPLNPKLVINRRTATALGLTIPSELLTQADEVLE